MILAGIRSYVDPQNGQGLTADEAGYLNAITANALNAINANLTSWQKYLQDLEAYKVKVQNAKTQSDLDQLKTQFPSRVTPSPLAPGPVNNPKDILNSKLSDGNALLAQANKDIQDSTKGLVLVDQTWINKHRVEGALVLDQANQIYRFQTDLHAAGTGIFVTAANVTIDLNGHTIFYGGNNRNGTMGINLFASRTPYAFGSDDTNYSFTTTAHWNEAKDLTVKNGTIQWEGSTGTWTSGIGTVYGGGVVTVDNMHIVAGGSDGWAVQTKWANLTMHDSYVEDSSNATEDRHQGPAAVGSLQKVIAYNNIIVGGNSGINAGSGSDIFNNIIRQSGFATNGYGVFTYEATNIVVHNNLIIPSNGRGLIFGGQSNTAYDNLIVVHELPNGEFGDNLNPPGFRMRYNADKNEIYNNKVLSIGGGANTGASGVYLSNYPGNSNYIHDNEFRAILTTPPDLTHYANAITLEGESLAGSSGTLDRIENNILASNNYLIRGTGYDGGSNVTTSLIGNKLEWVGGNETYDWLAASVKNQALSATQALLNGVPDNMSRATFAAGYWINNSDFTLIDTKLDPDVAMNTADFKDLGGSGSTNIKIGHSLYITAKDSTGSILANQTITVSDNTGLTFTGTTDTNGAARLELIDYALVIPTGGNAVTKAARTGESIVISGHSSLAVSLSAIGTLNSPLALIFS